VSYAEKTDVPVSKTQGEIRTMVNKAGALSFAIFEERERVHMAFELQERRVRFTIPMPPPAKAGDRYSKARDQAVRSGWRALMLVIKAKLESVASKIETFDEAFLAHIQRPNGRTVMEEIRENNLLFYKAADVPLLPSPRP
jgi:hypothetical protein